MIDETRPRTRAEQRDATRAAIVAAAADCLVEDGYAAWTTRRVAERAGVAQSTLMHHFPARERLLIEAVERLAWQLAQDALRRLDIDALRSRKHRNRVLDETWRTFTSPQALAAAQLWSAAWSEPKLAAALNELEERIGAIVMGATTTLFRDAAEQRDLAAMVDAAMMILRGLVMAIPINGREAVDARWRAIKPLLDDAVARLFD
ncbi:MAG TPA: TetR/AcrR family transcriptional regulator [Solirubrobacteraceae bacterium]